MSGLPFGAAEIVAAVAGALASARRGLRQRAADGGTRADRREVTGFDTNAAQLEVARSRAA